MIKKIVAGVLAVVMLTAMTGCTETPEEPVSGTLTFDELTDMLGVSAQQPEQTIDELSLPVSFKLTNSPELLDFMQAVTENRPVTYTNTLKEFGADGVLEDVTYTVEYDGASAYITRQAKDGVTGATPIVQFGMGMLAQACQDMAGNFDQALFEQMMSALNMDYWFKYYPYHMLYGVNAVIAVTADGQYLVFDYYFDSSVTSMLSGYGIG